MKTVVVSGSSTPPSLATPAAQWHALAAVTSMLPVPSPDPMGTHAAERVVLATLPSGVELATTVHRYEGAADGPTVYLQAAQHGREVNGTEVLRRFHERLDPGELAGTVIAVPVADPLTFDRVSYTAPEVFDSLNPNMNRVWPGSATGSLRDRMAARLWEYVEGVDAVVDLHTGSPEMYPHVVYREREAPSRALAEAFGLELLLAVEDDVDAGSRGFAGKLRLAAAREGIPAITPELGYSKRILEDVVEDGVDGLFGVLRTLDALDGEPPAWEGAVGRGYCGRVRAPVSGLFRATPEHAVGERVVAGADLGTIYHPTRYEPLADVTAGCAGVLYALARESTVVVGDTLANVARVD